MDDHMCASRTGKIFVLEARARMRILEKEACHCCPRGLSCKPHVCASHLAVRSRVEVSRFALAAWSWYGARRNYMESDMDLSSS